jgi:release factor glutamine methyltransferase
MASVQQVAAILADAGVPSPQHDAQVLIGLAASGDIALDELIGRRVARVPLQHLTGSAGFRYLDLVVGPGVFVPRPETELLVDVVLTSITHLSRPRVVDLCAGSGAIGLSVAYENPNVEVHLVENSTPAFAFLERNAQSSAFVYPLGLTHRRSLDSHRSTGGIDRVHLHHADLAAAPVGLDGTIDVVVANPPYLPLDERDLVDPEVRDHDPAEALWAGEDGLEVIHRVIDRSLVLLRPGGRVIIEHSDRHGEVVPQMLTAAGLRDVRGHHDLTGRPRFAEGVTRADPGV